MLVEAFRQLCQKRGDVALVVVGAGPYETAMRRDLAAQPAYFLPEVAERDPGALYGGCDLLVWPSAIDPLPQSVVEAQSCGLPVLVADRGSAPEMVDDGLSGLVLPAGDPTAWAAAIDQLLDDEPRRLRMARTGPHRVARFTPAKAFDSFWEEHVKAVRADRSGNSTAPAARPARPKTAPSMEVEAS